MVWIPEVDFNAEGEPYDTGEYFERPIQGVLMADYDRGYGFSNYEHGVLDYVTHWMPLELPTKTLWQELG